jgi:hypothetical protein
LAIGDPPIDVVRIDTYSAAAGRNQAGITRIGGNMRKLLAGRESAVTRRRARRLFGALGRSDGVGYVDEELLDAEAL